MYECPGRGPEFGFRGRSAGGGEGCGVDALQSEELVRGVRSRAGRTTSTGEESRNIPRPAKTRV